MFEVRLLGGIACLDHGLAADVLFFEFQLVEGVAIDLLRDEFEIL